MIIDYKPKNESILDAKPVNEIVFDAKPSNSANGELTDQLYDSTISVGMPMGLLLVLTYPNTFTFQTSFHP